MRDDLGFGMLRRHPRGGLWRDLDVAVACLTFEQTLRMAELATEDGRREDARTRVLAGLTGEVAGRLASRWVRWADTFSLPMPDLSAPLVEQLSYPYRPVDTAERQEYQDSLVPVFDAALGILGAACDERGEADFQVLTGPWRRVCLPSRFDAASAFGPNTQVALSVLRFAEGMSASALRRMVDARAVVSEDVWNAARRETDQAVIEEGFPYRVRCLYWEAVGAAEDAADESPTDRELVDALWGAAVIQILSDFLTAETVAVLTGPFRASGAVLPG
ncbi:MAG: hypothetical protein JXA67_15655 [Micromonosporaceae bacterium]|nr:hypothetical protein [Micromonosporaceae bacterium]